MQGLLESGFFHLGIASLLAIAVANFVLLFFCNQLAISVHKCTYVAMAGKIVILLHLQSCRDRINSPLPVTESDHVAS